jgi:predicted 3-demethylubiquinone-9 3-methyltransferase (glyoxalase superfamily)
MTMSTKQKITPFLWFNDNAEEATNFYVSIFRNSKTLNVARYGDAGPGPKGTVMSITFQLEGQEFMALNGGPQFKFTEGSSMVVLCDTQAEIDRLWGALLAGGGREQQCGWLKDRYGLPWQIVPARLRDMMKDPDQARADRVMAAVMKMVKLDIAKLEAAYKGA